MKRLERITSIHEFPDYSDVVLKDEYPTWLIQSSVAVKGFCIYCGKMLKKNVAMEYCSAICRDYGKWAVHFNKVSSLYRAMHYHYGFECCKCHAHLSYITPAGVELPIYIGEVDHILPLNHGGGDKISNLQLLCEVCHSEKTKSENHSW